MDPMYMPPINNFGFMAMWDFGQAEDESFFNALPEEKQRQILADCATSQQFHEQVRIARLCE